MQHPTNDREVHRPTAPRVLAVCWWVLAAVLLVDLALGGSWPSGGVAACVLLLLVLLSYAYWWIPSVVADPDAVTLHNPLRDVRIPWPTVIAVGGRWTLDVRTEERRYTAYAAAPRRRSVRPGGGGGFAPGAVGRAGAVGLPEAPQPPRTPLAERLSARWEQQRLFAPAGPVEVRWRWDVIAAAVLLLGALAVLLAL